MPERIHTDHGVNFESELMKQLCILCGIKKSNSSTYHPMGNGAVERMNRTLKPGLAKYVNDEHNDWDTYLPLATQSYNTSFHSSIGMSPYEALYARKPVLVADVILDNQLPQGTSLRTISNYVIGLRIHAEYIAKLIKQRTSQAQENQKYHYDKIIQNKIFFKISNDQQSAISLRIL